MQNKDGTDEDEDSQNQEEDYDNYELNQRRMQSVMIINENVSMSSDQLDFQGITEKQVQHSKT